MRCMEQPVSWLTLERYYLKELAGDEQRRVAAHLAACPACAACAQAIETDARALPPLPAVLHPERPRRAIGPRLIFAFAAAVAAIVVALFFRPDMPAHREPSADRLQYKGGELALTLVRKREGAVQKNPDRYLPGDRFRLFATVPGHDEVLWEVAIFQSGKVYFPYETRSPIGPGNNIPLPGAFRLTGSDPIEICIVVGERLPNRARIEQEGRQALPKGAVCYMLTAAPEETP